jgi:hypothetical protein
VRQGYETALIYMRGDNTPNEKRRGDNRRR